MGTGLQINVSLGPEWVKKAMVISHERSGTHFLMNTLADNFRYISMPWINIDIDNAINTYAPANIVGFLECMFGKPVLNIVKSHHPVEFFLEILPVLLDHFWIFYVYRDGDEVMESLAKHLQAETWDMGPKVENGAILARTMPSGALLRYQKVQYGTMWERWQAHVNGWLNLPHGLRARIIYVPFEALRNELETVVRFIALRIGRTAPGVIVRPGKFDRVVTPDIRKDIPHNSTD